MNNSKQVTSEAIYKKYHESVAKLYAKEYDHETQLEDFSAIKEQSEVLEPLMTELYHSSGEDMLFWRFCPLNTYKHNYPNLLKEFNQKFPDTTEIDFIEYELNSFYESYYLTNDMTQSNVDNTKTTLSFGDRLHIELIEDVPVLPICIIHSDLALKLFYSVRKKIDFLNQKKANMGISKPLESISQELPIDYSNNPKIERIVFLHELGILDYLQNKMTQELGYFSPNKLSEILSTFTDIQYKTVQPYINPMYSDAHQKNNPLTEKNVSKVVEKLNRLGFNKTKSS